jgi:integrase
LDIGTFGEIHTVEVQPGLWEARARFRLRNGRIVRPRKRRPGKTSGPAVRALKAHMATLADEVSGRKINGDTRLSHVMDLWLADFAEKVTLGKRAPKSLEEYRSVINRHLRPRMGELACREAENAGLVDETLKEIRRDSAAAVGTRGNKRGKTGTAGMLRARTVLSHVCGYAVRHGAMRTNPVKSAEAIDHDQNEIVALEPEQRADFFERFRRWISEKLEGENRLGPRARAWIDLADIIEAELATGCRIGEVLALTGDSIDLAAPKAVADHHLVRVTGQGLVRMPNRKGGRPAVEAALPSWSLPMWRRRKLESGGGPLFPTWNGQWQDPSNVGKRIKSACEAIGYGWVSSRILRHTTATHIVDSGLTSADAADALGNSVEVIEGNYRRKQRANPRVAVALESLMGAPADG